MSAIATTPRDEVLIARNPATGLELGRVTATPPEQIEELVARARARPGIVVVGRMASASGRAGVVVEDPQPRRR